MADEEGDTTPDWAMDTRPSGPSAPGPKRLLEPKTMLTSGLEIVRLLGSGGQGDVYEVRDLTSGLHQAIKLLNKQVSGDSKVVARLEREATTASAIQHPNVTRIFGLERTPSGQVFLRMELLRGRSLSDRLAKHEPMPIDMACDLVRQIADGLSAAHDLNVIHRDIKPANIFIIDGPSGPIVKIMDFGIAKAAASWDLTALTHTGSLIGTPAYMSPEQIMLPDQLDHRTDIYSLGLVFYEMLTGRRAFSGREVPQILMAQVKQSPAHPKKMRPAIPRPIADVVLRCLAKRPDSRFSSTRALIERLDQARHEPDAPEAPTLEDRITAPSPISRPFTAPPPRASSAWSAWLIGALACCVVAMTGAVFWFGLEAEAPVAAKTEAIAPLVPPAPPPPAPPPPAAPINGAVKVTSDPSGAVVSLGKTVLGVTPFSQELAPNVEHRLSVRADGHEPIEVPVRVRPGETWSRHVKLVKSATAKRAPKRALPPPAPPPPPQDPQDEHGYLTISTKPWVDVSIRGRPIGTTPIYRYKLPPGTHELRLVNAKENIEQVRAVEVRAGQTTKHTIDLRSGSELP